MLGNFRSFAENCRIKQRVLHQTCLYNREHSKYVCVCVCVRVPVSVYVILSWIDGVRDRQSVSFLHCY